MRPIFPAKFAGFAVTVALKKESNGDPNALKGMLTAIDSGNADSVYVMSVEDGVDIAGMGGWMGTAMRARNFSGAVIAGGVRDVAYLNKIGFPVYLLGIVPSTSIRHYRFASANTTVHCDGVEVNARDIVVVPRGVAGDVLAVAEKMDFNEHSMYSYIEKLKSTPKRSRDSAGCSPLPDRCRWSTAQFESIEAYIREQQTLALRRCSQSGKRVWH